MTDTSLISTKPIDIKDRLIFALDVGTCEEAKELVKQLGDSVNFYKLGLELFMNGGYFDLVRWLIDEQDKKVFVDLKFFDVPRTVGSAVRQLRKYGVSFATVHGNDSIMQAAVEESGDNLGILAVTALTSLDRGDLDDLGFDCNIDELVLSRAKRALEIGCAGVISSGLEAPRLREYTGDKLVVITPGIRPIDNTEVDDQKRTVDVRTAFLNGADYIVVGRPIRNADNPPAKAAEIQRQIQGLFTCA